MGDSVNGCLASPMSDADKAKRLVLIRAAWKRYAKERARMEYTLRRAGSVEPHGTAEDLPDEGSSVE